MSHCSETAIPFQRQIMRQQKLRYQDKSCCNNAVVTFPGQITLRRKYSEVPCVK